MIGSVHVLSKDFYPLSPALETAYKSSDLLVEEVDMGEMLAPGAQMQLLSRGLLTGEQSLDKVLTPATYALLAKKLAEVGAPVEALKRMKPWMIALTLEALQWQKAGFDADLGLDKHFYDQAQQDGKQVRGSKRSSIRSHASTRCRWIFRITCSPKRSRASTPSSRT